MVSIIVTGILSVAAGVYLGFGWGIDSEKHNADEIRKKNKELIKKNNELRSQSDFWYTEYSESQQRIEYFRQERDKYQRAYKELILMQHGSNGSVDVDSDIREAIKFAMTNSHPDKPSGNQEKFVKFHKLYKKHCK